MIEKLDVDNRDDTLYRVLAKKINEIIDTLSKPSVEVPSVEEIEKVVSDIVGVEKEQDLLKYRIWKKGIKDIAQAIHNLLTGK